eukprot:2951560-Prymnesium_polylepis.3
MMQEEMSVRSMRRNCTDNCVTACENRFSRALGAPSCGAAGGGSMTSVATFRGAIRGDDGGDG